MLHPIAHAKSTPDKPAYIMATSGEIVTYGELDARANQGAHLLREIGIKRGDHICLFMDNSPRFFEVVAAVLRVGAYVTAISSKLNTDEAEYIVRDSGSRVLIVSYGVADIAQLVRQRLENVACYSVDGGVDGFERFERARDQFPVTPIADPQLGMVMLYSSGTTGRPKGIRFPLPEAAIGDAGDPIVELGLGLYSFSPDMVYLSPAPLYHAAPLNWCWSVMNLGGTVIIMERFDAEDALRAIQSYKVTHGQWVPTHFIRMLKLPDDVRLDYDCSSLVSVWHAAAPCPIPVKEAMISWWGPIVAEYYSATEGIGFCAISADEWLQKKGSVGRALIGDIHICDDAGNSLPAGAEGEVFFAGNTVFEYHNDPEKTADASNQHGWSSVGDIGRVDEDGYLFLTDRKTFMIISGGVNIYPQEAENILIMHPKVCDVAVIGAPHDEMGEEVVAVVQVEEGVDANASLADELVAYARSRMSHVKAPRRVEFRTELPRHDTGKLYKKKLREEFWRT